MKSNQSPPQRRKGKNRKARAELRESCSLVLDHTEDCLNVRFANHSPSYLFLMMQLWIPCVRMGYKPRITWLQKPFSAMCFNTCGTWGHSTVLCVPAASRNGSCPSTTVAFYVSLCVLSPAVLEGRGGTSFPFYPLHIVG